MSVYTNYTYDFSVFGVISNLVMSNENLRLYNTLTLIQIRARKKQTLPLGIDTRNASAGPLGMRRDENTEQVEIEKEETERRTEVNGSSGSY